jgi:hypothetical protein
MNAITISAKELQNAHTDLKLNALDHEKFAIRPKLLELKLQLHDGQELY